MPIQLDKILADIAEEKALHPNSLASKIKKDHDDAWIKVGKKNKLSAHEAKSIFKVLQKKFEQEKLKSSSTWKLYQQMEDIHRKEQEKKPKPVPEPADTEDESFVEFLEVREEDEDDDGDSDTQDKSMKSNDSTGSPEKEKEKENTNHTDPKPEQKLLNTQMMMHNAPQSHNTSVSAVSAAFSNVLQKKGISMRKTVPVQSKQHASSSSSTKAAMHQKPSSAEATRTVAPPTEPIKRKASAVGKAEESAPAKRPFTVVANAANTARMTASPPTPTFAQLQQIEIKQEIVDDALEALATTGEPINVITIPSNPPTVTTDLPNGVTNTKTNGFNTRIEDIDFQKDIIFDNNLLNASKPSTAPGDIINIGNFDNQLPPTFFKNLCNSQRHEALGLYVANVMNRVSGKTAAKLELSILKAIIEAKTEELARL